MKTKQFLLLGILGLSFQILNAQTMTVTTAVTPSVSTTIDGGTSTRFGTLAGNGSLSIGGYNSFIGFQSGKVNTTGKNNTFLGYQSGKLNTSGTQNVFLGCLSGTVNTTGNTNVFIGHNSGSANTTGGANIYIGTQSGGANISGSSNTFVGNYAGGYSTVASFNTFLGALAGANNGGNGNVAIGYNAGEENISGSNNTIIGYEAGWDSTGSGNVFIGKHAGYFEYGDNKLYIDNSEIATPLIFGDFALDQIKLHGQVGIGGNSTTAFGVFPANAGGVNVSNYKLFVYGGILTEEVRVSLANTWADYVFNKDYNLKPLNEVENYINSNGHLPNVPSAKEVKENGVELGEMAKIQQEKIEELTLYIIELNKRLNDQEAKINELSKTK